MLRYSFKTGIVIALCLLAMFTVVVRYNALRPKQLLTASFIPRGYLNSEILNSVKKIATHQGDNKTKKQSMPNPRYGLIADVYYGGRRVAMADSLDNAYCSGMTFQVFMQACVEASGDNFILKGVSSTNIDRFRKDWYGTDGNKRTLVDALISRDLGLEVKNPAEAAPGDFVQFWWRNGYGHSVVFLNWIYDDGGKISGIHYWSAEHGNIGENTDMIGGVGRMIDSDQIYIVRAYEP